MDETTVLAFLDGSLPAEGRGKAEAHIARCSACMELTTWAALDGANLSRQPGEERRPIIGQLEPGARVGRYQILAPVGRGGMGEVYAAYHPDLDRRIALKVVYETDAGSAERRARLLREARAIARLSHHNVVAVHDAGTIGDRVFIAMEFVDGDTIDEWLRRQHRSWRQILDVFLAAGRGLAAAHTAGIIHRDFKPQNVMVGKDGSVRVMDFGLARLVAEADIAPAGDDAAPSTGDMPPDAATKVTRTGTLLGTPAYMAPEQFRGEAIDARADQFSFSVALHEALHGTRPAIARPLADAKAPVNAEAEESQTAGVPQWLRRVTARALAHHPHNRYPSMAQLLKAIESGRARPVQRTVVAGVTILIAILFFGGWRLSHARRFDCRPPADRIANAWGTTGEGSPQRDRLHEAFLAAGSTEARDIWQRLSSALDSYMVRWSAMYQEACQATHERGEQSETVLDLRMRCLNDNLGQVRALTEVLTSVDLPVATSALDAVARITPVSRCADVPLLRSAVPLPQDDAVLNAVQALQRELAQAEALYQIGRLRDALAAVTGLVPRARTVGYKPLLANVLDLHGRIRVEQDLPKDAEVALYEAFSIAAEGADDLTAARSATGLAYSLGFLEGRHQDGLRWVRIAAALLARAKGSQEVLHSWIVNDEGAIRFHMGDLEEARRLFEASLKEKELRLGSNHSDVGSSLTNVGTVLSEQGNQAAALSALDRAIDILLNTSGPNSTRLANALQSRGEALLKAGRNAEATNSLLRALAVYEAQKLEGPVVSDPLFALGRVAMAERKPIEAIPHLQRALRMRAQEIDTTRLADTQLVLASALWESGGDRSRALSLAREARAIYVAHERPRQVQEVDAWLGTHRVRR